MSRCDRLYIVWKEGTWYADYKKNQHINHCAPHVSSVILNCCVYDIARIAVDSNSFKWDASYSWTLCGCRVDKFTFSKSGPITTMFHFIPFGLPPWNILTPFFQCVKPWAWQASKASPRLLFIPLWLISGPLLEGGGGGGPDGAVWEHIPYCSCVMHICLNPAPPPAQMTSSSTDHHELTVGVSLFIAYNFTALSRKHHSVPLLYNAVKRTDWSVLYLS